LNEGDGGREGKGRGEMRREEVGREGERRGETGRDGREGKRREEKARTHISIRNVQVR
jgi:hypothetical protein